MGSLNPFSTPKMPGPDPEAQRLKEEERQRQAMERQRQEDRRQDMNRRVASNLIGSKSLQDDELEGFTGYRRNMGNNKSLRY